MATPVPTPSVACYAVLRVRFEATQDEIDAAYKAALESLPSSRFGRWLAAFCFNRTPETILDAYQTLSNPAAREEYDAKIRESGLLFAPPF